MSGMVTANFKGMDFKEIASKFHWTNYYSILPIIGANEREQMHK
jgi:hypothetical protein